MNINLSEWFGLNALYGTRQFQFNAPSITEKLLSVSTMSARNTPNHKKKYEIKRIGTEQKGK